MRLNEYASTRRTRGSYKIPTSVQKSIPIDEIYADGTWRSGEVYSQMWSVSDINYAMQSDDKKQDILAKMGRIYSNIPTDCWAQLCIVSQRMDEISFERDVLYHRANDGLDAYRVERNRLMKAYAKEIGNVKQQKYLILSTNKQNSKDARERLNQVQRNMLGELSNIGCKVCALDNNARLEVLHNFFRIGEETHFQFDFDNCTRLGQDFRDAIAPDAMRFCKQCGRSYCKKYLEYICVDDMGNLVNPNYISGNFSNILRKNGLRPIRFHDLRHSCASLLIKNKIPMKDVQVWMGHSSFATTANIYAHIDTDSKQEAADMISACISLSGSPDKKVGKKSPPKRSA